jgi:hypothetical protein
VFDHLVSSKKLYEVFSYPFWHHSSVASFFCIANISSIPVSPLLADFYFPKKPIFYTEQTNRQKLLTSFNSMPICLKLVDSFEPFFLSYQLFALKNPL